MAEPQFKARRVTNISLAVTPDGRHLGCIITQECGHETFYGGTTPSDFAPVEFCGQGRCYTQGRAYGHGW